MPRHSPQQLTEFARALLKAGGANTSEAERVAFALVDANLRGFESHGVMRIPSYVDRLADGGVRTGATLEILRESPTHLVADGQWGFGQVLAKELTDRLCSMAKAQGHAIGTLHSSGHVGRLGEYCEMAARQNLVSLVMVNTHGAARRVAPPGGKAPRLGTNPLALGAPHGDTPLILDFSTSVTAEGKVRVKRISGEKCPEGWLLDCEGKPTTDPNSLYGTPPGSILPMGGEQAYKGFGLALMIDIFAGAITGASCAREKPVTPLGNAVFMMILDPAAFGGAEHFKTEVELLIETIRNTPRIEGVSKITLPGDPERENHQRLSRDGVEIDDENWAALLAMAQKLSVPVPR
jgi:hydroxycarboxylate dehydrogenase B